MKYKIEYSDTPEYWRAFFRGAVHGYTMAGILTGHYKMDGDGEEIECDFPSVVEALQFPDVGIRLVPVGKDGNDFSAIAAENELKDLIRKDSRE